MAKESPNLQQKQLLRLRCLIPAALAVVAFHLGWFWLFGPGAWGSGVIEKVPSFLSSDTLPIVGAYRLEFLQDGQEPLPAALPVEVQAIRGRIEWKDCLKDSHVCVIESHEGKRWIDDQHVYIWLNKNHVLHEIQSVQGMTVSNPTIVNTAGQPSLILERWNSWFLPWNRKILRYVQSWFNDPLRPEYSLYACGIDCSHLEYLGPGHGVVISPDRQKVAFLRSEDAMRGFHSLHVWERGTHAMGTICSLWEADPGSGISFQYRWSNDSMALHLTGETQGFSRAKMDGYTQLNLIYLANQKELVQLW